MHPLLNQCSPYFVRRRGIISASLLPLLIVFPLVFSRSTDSFARKVGLQVDLWQCLSFTMPADSVAYDDNLAHAAALVSFDPAYKLEGDRRCVFRFEPLHRFALESGDHDLAIISTEISFVHERTSANGHHRLVAIASPLARDYLAMISVVYKIDHLFGLAEKVKVSERMSDVECAPCLVTPISIPANQHLLVYFGQADPLDSSHFTFQYEVNGVSGVIDGWLCNNDAIYLRSRSGPYRMRDAKSDLRADWLGIQFRDGKIIQ